MAAFVQLKNRWLNLDRVDVVCLDPDTGNVTVVWADQTRSTYHGEDAQKLLEAMKPLNTSKMHASPASARELAAEIPHGGMESVNIGTVSEYPRSSIKIVEAGVDPKHQTEQCDHCKKSLTGNEACQTNDGRRYLTLCRECYDEAGNSVR